MQTIKPLQQATSSRAFTYIAYISFVPIGIATVILGPMLPPLSARWEMNYSQGGILILVQYLASTCAVGFSGLLAARRGFLFPMKVGIALMSIGLALLLSTSKTLALVGIAGNGAGLGLAVPAANLLVAAANPTRRSATLNLLNFFWSTGAVSCPFLVAAAVDNHHIPSFLIGLSSFSLALALAIALISSQIVEPIAATNNKSPILPIIRLRQNSFLILAALFFLYVGVENSFGEWMASYSKSLGTMTLAVALMTPSFFYASLTVGRMMAPAFLHLTSEITLGRAGLLLGCIGMTGLIFSHRWLGVVCSAVAAGFGLASVYPISIALFSKEFQSARIGSVMFVLSNIGGGLLPWFVGVSSTKVGSLRAGLAVPLAGCALMLCLFMRNWNSLENERSQPIPNNPGA
jgi:MFS transporter, FHS family, glucose/mannose:H+ symporter